MQTWRPCCGKCRGERLREVNDPRPHGEHAYRCEDCGATWDGSELTAAEAADRPPSARNEPGGAGSPEPVTEGPGSGKRAHGAI